MDTVSPADTYAPTDKHSAPQQPRWTLTKTVDTTSFIHQHKVYCHRSTFPVDNHADTYGLTFWPTTPQAAPRQTKKEKNSPPSGFLVALPTRIWHICKATQANPQPKLCKRAKSSRPLNFHSANSLYLSQKLKSTSHVL